MKLGLIQEFEAAHRLPGYDGKCARVHGHTYRVEMAVEGPMKDDGFVMDFYDMKKHLAAALEDFDHRDLNEVLENPTAELIATAIFERLHRRLDGTGVNLIYVKLWEGRNKWVMAEC